MASEATDLTQRVRDYWERASCGTDVAESDKFTRAYFEQIEEFRYRYDPWVHGFAQFTRWHGKKVLEVGIGAGTDFLQFVRAGAHAYGVDLTEEAMRNVRARLAVYGLEAEDLQRCNAENLPFPDGFFDLAYSNGVIHHAEHTERILQEMVRVTRPGGTVKVMVYGRNNPYCLYMWLRHGLPRLKSLTWVMQHFQESPGTKIYTPSTIRSRLLRDVQYEDLRISSYDSTLREGARFRALRSFLIWLTPPQHHWFLCVEFRKPAVRAR